MRLSPNSKQKYSRKSCLYELAKYDNSGGEGSRSFAIMKLMEDYGDVFVV